MKVPKYIKYYIRVNSRMIILFTLIFFILEQQTLRTQQVYRL